MKYIILYGTSACHLCEEAEVLLKEIQEEKELLMKIIKVDVTESDDLMCRYGLSIPVVLDKESGADMGWPFDYNALVHFLEAR